MQTEEFSRPMQVGQLRRGETEATFEASAEECAALAKRMGIAACRSLSARLTFRVSGDGRRVTGTGRLTARVVQTCVVTLAPVEQAIDVPVSLLFLDESLLAEDRDVEDVAAGDDDPIADPIRGGRFDPGAVLAEHLALALDPYPRAEGARLDAPAAAPDEEVSGPFAALSALKDGENSR